MLNKLFTTIALEEDTAKSSTVTETEIVVFAKIGEPARLAEAQSKEEHIQLEGRFETGVPARVRKISKEGNVEYIFTMKTPSSVDGVSNITANKEYSINVTEDFFNGFMLAATRKLVKTRYTFNSTNVELTFIEGSQERSIVIPNVVYEVDVYTKEDGKIAQWCKIDIEVDTILDYINKNHKELKDLKLIAKISHLPFAPKTPILTTNATDEQRITIDEIWKELTQSLNKAQV